MADQSTRRFSPLVVLICAMLFSTVSPRADAQASPGSGRTGVTEPDTSTLRQLFVEDGEVFPTGVKPLSREALARISGDLPSGPGITGSAADGAATAFSEALDYREGELRLEVGLDVRPQAYLDWNREEREFLEVRELEAPLLRLDTSFGVDGGPKLVTGTVLQREYDIDSPTNIPLPEEGNPLPFENNGIYTGYVQVPGEYLETTFGRQQIHIGPSPYSSLLVSDRIPYLDAARLSLRLGRLRMTHLVSTLENTASDPEEAAGLPELLESDAFEHGGQYAYDKNIIFYNVHYFEYAWRRLRLGVAGQMVVSRPMNQFHLGDFFPVFSWHNADLVPNNMCMVIDATYALTPGLSAYLQAGWDDISARTFGVADSELPTISGYIAGLRYDRRTGNRLLHALIEGGYTHYLWGSFHEEFALSRAIYRQDVDGDPRAMPLTSPFGPGSVWAMSRLEHAWANGFEIGIEYLFRSENTRANLYDTPYRAAGRLEGAPRRSVHRLAVEPRFSFSSGFGLSAEPAVLLDEGEPAVEARLTASYRYGATRRPRAGR